MRKIFAIILLSTICFSSAAFAVQPDEMLSDSKMEARARHISEGLRCLVCQNQSIDDSDADLAHDLRVLVRQRLQAGDTDEQVRQYLVSRYGDYVLLDPPFKLSTYALWLLPPVFLVTGMGLAWFFFRQRREGEDAPLSVSEQARLDSLLSRDGDGMEE